MLPELAFESRNVVSLVGVSERELRHWADRGIVVPDIADAVGRPGVRRQYSFENLLQAAIIKELLRQGINLHEAAKMGVHTVPWPKQYMSGKQQYETLLSRQPAKPLARR